MSQQESVTKVIEVIKSLGHTIEEQSHDAGGVFIETNQNISGHYAEVLISEEGKIDVAFGRGKIEKALKEIA